MLFRSNRPSPHCHDVQRGRLGALPALSWHRSGPADASSPPAPPRALDLRRAPPTARCCGAGAGGSACSRAPLAPLRPRHGPAGRSHREVPRSPPPNQVPGIWWIPPPPTPASPTSDGKARLSPLKPGWFSDGLWAAGWADRPPTPAPFVQPGAGAGIPGIPVRFGTR